jgi:hypothetical protein
VVETAKNRIIIFGPKMDGSGAVQDIQGRVAGDLGAQGARRPYCSFSGVDLR